MLRFGCSLIWFLTHFGENLMLVTLELCVALLFEELRELILGADEVADGIVEVSVGPVLGYAEDTLLDRLPFLVQLLHLG